jgi:membrane protein implicated in regulation of membrane protease activity
MASALLFLFPACAWGLFGIYSEGGIQRQPMAFVIYIVCLGVGLVFTLVSAFLGHAFGGHADHGHVGGSHGHAEAGADGSDMPGVSALSPTVLASFVTAFGGVRVILSQFPATRPPLISAPLSIIGGFLIAAALLAVLRSLFSHTQSSSESRVASLVGQTATVISPIPVNGVGEIAYVQAGTRYTAPARLDAPTTTVGNGGLVRIVRVVGHQFYVTPTE